MLVIKTTTIYTHVSKMATIKISSPLDRLVDVNNKKNLVIIKNIKKHVYILMLYVIPHLKPKCNRTSLHLQTIWK
jgi:hypothetical protein